MGYPLDTLPIRLPGADANDDANADADGSAAARSGRLSRTR